MDFVFRRGYRGPVRLVVLDWAGTTLDYGCMAPARVFIDVYRRAGVEISVEEARAPMGLHKREHIAAIGRSVAVAARWSAEHGRAPTEDDIEQMFVAFQPLQLACLPEHAELIPGTVETIAALRARSILIGSTTGYFTAAMELLLAEAARRGYAPDVSVCATQVPAGRPEPWMVFANMRQARVYPAAAVVKVDDTRPGIAEGLNAGCWTVGIAKTGNEIGLSADELAALAPDELERRLGRAREALAREGAHYVIDSIAELAPVIDEIGQRLSRGERP